MTNKTKTLEERVKKLEQIIIGKKSILEREKILRDIRETDWVGLSYKDIRKKIRDLQSRLNKLNQTKD